MRARDVALREWIAHGFVLTLLLPLIGCGRSYEAPVNPLATGAATSPFAGKFVGDTLTAEFKLDADGKTLTGTITHGGATYSASAKEQGDRIVGTFITQGKELAFVATLRDKTLSLESGGATHVMTRHVEAPPANPLAATQETPTRTEPGQAPPADAIGIAKLEMQTYKHAVGFTFEHPKGWEVKEGEGNLLVMVPSDARKDEQGRPLELLMIGSDDASGINDLSDPQVMQYFDQQFAQMFPDFRRVGGTDKLQTLLGDGIVLSYEGKTPTGLDGKGAAYATLHRGSGIMLIHLGEKGAVVKRKGVARRIFSSFGWIQGQIDNNLVGTWRRSESDSSSIDSRGYIGGTTTKTWVFASDGTVAYGIGTAIYGHSAGSGYQISVDPRQKGSVSKGTWSVSQTTLTVLWDEGGTSTYEYKVFPHVENQTGLKLVQPGAKKPLYFIKQ